MMNLVRSRDEFIDYCYRQLGAPVIEVNVAEEQAEDRVNDALQMYFQYHIDATYREVITVKLTEENIKTQTITLDKDIIGVIDVVHQPNSNFSLQNLQYQMYFSDLISRTFSQNDGMSSYTITRSYLSMLGQLVGGIYNVTDFRLHGNDVIIQYDWGKLKAGDYIGLEVHRMLDSKFIWDDYWLKQYATALMRTQWGTNLMKYSGPGLPGGGQLNGAEIYQAGLQDKQTLEDRLYNEFQYMAYGFMA